MQTAPLVIAYENHDWIEACGVRGGYAGAVDDSKAERARIVRGEWAEIYGRAGTDRIVGVFPDRVRTKEASS